VLLINLLSNNFEKNMKYKAKHDIQTGTKLKLIKEKFTSYGLLKMGEIVILEEITHFPTRFTVKDNQGKNWNLFSYDFEVINE
jgi:hypothetical protein